MASQMATDGQTGDNGEDRGEGHGGDEGEEDLATQNFGELRSSHVAIDDVGGGENGCRTKTEEGGEDVEQANDDHGPHHADTGRLGVGHGVEANQHVGQTRRAKEEGHAQRDQV